MEELAIRITIDGTFPRIVPSELAELQEVQYERDEVIATVKRCHSLKAPGPDGFNFSSVKKA